jgi:hypothetical protein
MLLVKVVLVIHISNFVHVSSFVLRISDFELVKYSQNHATLFRKHSFIDCKSFVYGMCV